MTVSRKEIFPETTMILGDIECEIDKQLKKPETLEMLKKYGVAVVSVFGKNIQNTPGTYELEKKYTELGWEVDSYMSNNVIVFFFE